MGGQTGIDTIGQSGYNNNYESSLPTGNIQTGYGPTGFGSSGMHGTSGMGFGSSGMQGISGMQGGSSALGQSLSPQNSGYSRSGGLGKNLYGETGYASSGYSIQQPFPGQTVYVEEDESKISDKVKNRFYGGGNVM